MSKLQSTEKKPGFFGRISRDADELISRTIVEATGNDFEDFVNAGKPPPISLFFKAYFHTACFHSGKAVGKAFSSASGSPKSTPSNRAELLNRDGEIIGYTDVSMD